MNPFNYSRPKNLAEVFAQAGPLCRFIAGGTNLTDLMQENVEQPQQLIDINQLPLRDIETTAEGGMRVGALISNSDLAWEQQIEQRYPLLSQAILSGASPQLRNKATIGGNLLQRTRCYYFYDTSSPCNKRTPGSGCSAREDANRIHAILGASESCVAVHPSDLCVALAALDTTVIVHGPDGERRIPFTNFHRLPEDEPERDNTLAANELVTAIELPAKGFSTHSAYLKVRDRASYAFALISVAAALELDGLIIRQARVALGGVAHKPWRVAEAEALLVDQPATERTFVLAAERLLEGAQPLSQNGFKLELAQHSIVQALGKAARGIY